MEASADLIDALKIELDEFKSAVNSFGLKPLPGETSEGTSMQLSTATKSVSSTVEVKKSCQSACFDSKLFVLSIFFF